MYQLIFNSISNGSLNEVMTKIITSLILILAICIISFIADKLTKKFILKLINNLVKKTKFTWDDVFMENKVFEKLSLFVPAIIFYTFSYLPFPDRPDLVLLIQKVITAYMAFIFTQVILSVLDSVDDIYQNKEIAKEKPIKSYIQVVKIIIYFVAGIIIIATLMDKSPWAFLSGLGALSAVIMLVFKDSILGFVASIQLSAQQMVQVGDWIEMPKYNADGNIIDITLNTIKVRNWDNTITTVPTYALISDSFKNWRGMSESGGRRIKRSILIDISSIRFCDEKMLERFKNIQLLDQYLEGKKKEISEYNQKHQTNLSLLNGRCLTNVGTFRAYIQAYLKNNDFINKDLTFLVRHLAPTDKGLPIEIYIFSSDKRWVYYEGIQADIFDHLLASLKEFDLRAFQNPTGYDFQKLISPQSPNSSLL